MLEQLISIFKDAFEFIVALSILIVVHEWGHFITAKRLGIKVERFSLGFGPKIFSKIHDGTEFLLCLIPVGGYVKMAGDERSHHTGRTDEFYSKSPGERALVVINGPVVNFILAYICFVVVFLFGFPGLSTRIGFIEDGSPAQRAGLLAGDKITAIDSKKVYGWESLEYRLEGNDPRPVAVTVERDGTAITEILQPVVKREKNHLGLSVEYKDIGVRPVSYSNVIGDVLEGKPAQKAGLQKGDRIRSINGNKISTWEEIQDAVKNSPDAKVTVIVLRAGKEISNTIELLLETVKDASGTKKEIRIIGIVPVFEFDAFRFSLFDSIYYGAEELVYITQKTYQALWGMVTGTVSAGKNVGGPVLIFTVFQAAANEGLTHWVFILGVVSASLAIFNLLPVIPLDGGHLFLFAIEKLRGKALSPKLDEYIARAGFSLIILLTIFVFYADFDRIGLIDKIKNIFQ